MHKHVIVSAEAWISLSVFLSVLFGLLLSVSSAQPTTDMAGPSLSTICSRSRLAPRSSRRARRRASLTTRTTTAREWKVGYTALVGNVRWLTVCIYIHCKKKKKKICVSNTYLPPSSLSICLLACLCACVYVCMYILLRRRADAQAQPDH